MSRLRFTHVLLAAATLSLTSCIDGREEYWLEADSSGRADVIYSLPAVAAKFQGGEAGVRKQVSDFLKRTPALTASTCEVAIVGDQLVIHVIAAFKSALELRELSQSGVLSTLPSPVAGLAGNVSVLIHGRTLEFSRTVTAAKALPGSPLMPRSSLAGKNLSYIVHLPTVALTSNATRTEDNGRTLVWIFPLEQALKSPVTTSFRAKIPIPRWLWLAVAGGSLLVIGVGALAARKLRSRRRFYPLDSRPHRT